MTYSGYDISGLPYKEVERLFLNDKRSFCENESPANCSCELCPTHEICNWLCTHDADFVEP